MVIAGGSGRLGGALAAALRGSFDVRVLRHSSQGEGWRCDLTSIAEAEVALAGAHTVVFLARTSKPPARLTQGAVTDLDVLMADSVSRAAARTGAEHLVFFACGEGDVREALLRASGVKMSVLHGGGADPVTALAGLVSASQAQDQVLPAWPGFGDLTPAPMKQPRVWSVQRFARPAGATAQSLAHAYFEWLPSSGPLIRVERIERVWRISMMGVPLLVMRHSPGKSEANCYVLDVVGGTLSADVESPGRFEFRVLRDESVAVALIDFAPSLSWPVFRFTQAAAHARTMRSFGKALDLKSAAAA